MSSKLWIRVLSGPVTEGPTNLDDWLAHHRAVTAGLELPFDRAVVAGATASRVAFAFASGYRSALEVLVGDFVKDHAVSLAVTEAGGGHPRAIESVLEPRPEGGFLLTGKKRWTTMVPGGPGLVLAVASQGAGEEGRKRLVVARVPVARAGVTVTPMAKTPFVPEIPHAELSFDKVIVAASEVLEGDGYERYVKPFRTIEDIHVHGAVLGYLIGLARRNDWPARALESLAGALAGLRALATEEPLDPGVHVALAGVMRSGLGAITDCEPHWEKVDAASREAWLRDRVLLQVAEGVRQKRLASAHERLRG